MVEMKRLYCGVGISLKSGVDYNVTPFEKEPNRILVDGRNPPIAAWRFEECFKDVVKLRASKGDDCVVNGRIDDCVKSFHGKLGKVLCQTSPTTVLVETDSGNIVVKRYACHKIESKTKSTVKEVSAVNTKRKELVNAIGIQNFTEGKLYDVEQKGTVYQLIDDLGYKKEVAIWRFDDRFIGAIPFNKARHEAGSMVVINAIGSATIDRKLHGSTGVVKDFGGEIVSVDVSGHSIVCPRSRVFVVDFQQTYDTEVEIVVSYRTRDGSVFDNITEAKKYADDLKRSKIAVQGLEIIKSAGYSQDQILQIQQLLNINL